MAAHRDAQRFKITPASLRGDYLRGFRLFKRFGRNYHFTLKSLPPRISMSDPHGNSELISTWGNVGFGPDEKCYAALKSAVALKMAQLYLNCSSLRTFFTF